MPRARWLTEKKKLENNFVLKAIFKERWMKQEKEEIKHIFPPTCCFIKQPERYQIEPSLRKPNYRCQIKNKNKKETKRSWNCYIACVHGKFIYEHKSEMVAIQAAAYTTHINKMCTFMQTCMHVFM